MPLLLILRIARRGAPVRARPGPALLEVAGDAIRFDSVAAEMGLPLHRPAGLGATGKIRTADTALPGRQHGTFSRGERSRAAAYLQGCSRLPLCRRRVLSGSVSYRA